MGVGGIGLMDRYLMRGVMPAWMWKSHMPRAPASTAYNRMRLRGDVRRMNVCREFRCLRPNKYRHEIVREFWLYWVKGIDIDGTKVALR